RIAGGLADGLPVAPEQPGDLEPGTSLLGGRALALRRGRIDGIERRHDIRHEGVHRRLDRRRVADGRETPELRFGLLHTPGSETALAEAALDPRHARRLHRNAGRFGLLMAGEELRGLLRDALLLGGSAWRRRRGVRPRDRRPEGAPDTPDEEPLEGLHV